MLTSEPRVTYAALSAWPGDGRRCELYDGEVRQVPAPLPLHQMAMLELAVLLRAHTLRAGGLTLVSPIDILFDEYNVLQPDIVVFTAARTHLVDPDRVIRAAPDVSVEIISPSTAGHDRTRKFRWFERFGVQEYWLLDPGRKHIEAHALLRGRYSPIFTGERDELFVSEVLEGFSCTVDSLLPRQEFGA